MGVDFIPRILGRTRAKPSRHRLRNPDCTRCIASVRYGRPRREQRGRNRRRYCSDEPAHRTGPARGRTWFFNFAHFASPKQTWRVGARHFCATRRTVWHCRCNAARGARHLPIFPRTFPRASRRMAVDARACSTIWRNSQCQCQPIG